MASPISGCPVGVTIIAVLVLIMVVYGPMFIAGFVFIAGYVQAVGVLIMVVYDPSSCSNHGQMTCCAREGNLSVCGTRLNWCSISSCCSSLA